MANIHGKSAAIYLSIVSGGVAIPIAEQVDWSIDFDQQIVDTSSLNQTWKTFVKGMQGWSGSFSGNFDTASTALWAASTDTTGAQNFYLYPQGSAFTGQYYYGTAWVQLGKIAAGSTTTKASSSFKITGQGALTPKP